jgi:hypothetical protein
LLTLCLQLTDAPLVRFVLRREVGLERLDLFLVPALELRALSTTGTLDHS